MSELSATQIPKPTDEQAFERANEILWRAILGDRLVKLHGRRGQKQDGVDLYGELDGSPTQIIGIQCKQKSEGKALDEVEVRQEVKKALGFRPLLSEYIIVTTSPDDAKLDRLALDLSQEVSEGREKPLKVRIYGWETLEREIRRYPTALKAFDPSHTPHGDQLAAMVEDLPNQVSIKLGGQLANIESILVGMTRVDTAVADVRLQSALEGEIDGYASLAKADPATALGLFRKLEQRLDVATSGRVRFRVAANIASCQLDLGDEPAAIAGLIAAHDYDPNNPKAVSNKALALLLSGNWPALKAFAVEKFAAMPDNASLASYFLQGAIGHESATEVEDLVPSGIMSSAEVMIARVRRAMEEGTPGEWQELAIRAQAAFPADDLLDEFRANALLDRVMSANGFRYGRVLSEAEQAHIEIVVSVLQRKWDKLRDTKPADSKKQVSTPLNLTLAYRLLHRTAEALCVVKQVMAWLPANNEVMERAVAIMLEAGERESARALIEKIDLNSETVQMRFNLAMGTQDWSAVITLVDDHLDLFPAHERSVAQASRIVAEVELAQPASRQALLHAARTSFVSDARAGSILAQSARINDLDDLAEHFFSNARQALRDDTSFAARMSVADEAMRRAEPGVAADLLVGHVDTSRDGPELRLLADALAHDCPVRERAVAFFDDLPETLRSRPEIQRLEAICRINRGMAADAAPLLAMSFAKERRLSTLMLLIGIYLQLDRRDEIAPLLADETLETLRGNPIDRMKLAQAIMAYGDRNRALRLGYNVLTEATDRPDVVLRYFGLFLRPDARPPLAVIGTVGSGNWVRLSRANGGGFEAIIGEPADRIWGAKAEESNVFVKRSLGLKPGDSFDFENGLGQRETWTVDEVKPRWLRAFHMMSETFGQRFAGATGFYMLTMKDGDTGPTLEQVRRYSEAVREHANLYLLHNMPLALVANRRSGGAVGFCDYLVSIGEEIRTSAGDADERLLASQLIAGNAGRGAVLDGLTAWRAAELDIFDVLASALGPLSLPASELNLLKSAIDDEMTDGVGEQMTLGYVNGEYYREVTTAEQRATHQAVLVERIAKIEAACSIEPVIIPNTLPETAEMLLKLPAGEAIAPAILARQDRLLLTDDLMMRQLMHHVFGCRGVWLQAALLYALDQKIIAHDRYCDALVLLAAHRHGFITTNVAVFKSVFDRDETSDLLRLRALLHYLGNEKADPKTHLDIAARFINLLWKNGPPDLKSKAATGWVLTAMLTRFRNKMWPYWGAHLWESLGSEARSYFLGWLNGHFMSAAAVNDVLNEAYLRNSSQAHERRIKRQRR
jgi:hypothetical protein